MDNQIKIKMLGIGACSLELENRRLFVDACNEFVTIEDARPDDILLFTHDDGDHFMVEKVLAHAPNNRIVGPPSIAYPLLSSGKIDPGQLTILYPPEKDKPLKCSVDGITLSVVQTEHFIDWNPVHISFLVAMGGKRIFVTGDSYVDSTRPHLYENLDCLIYSLIKKEVVKGQMGHKAGVIYHLHELQEIKDRFHPKMIICNHVLNCGWSVDSKAMEECLRINHVEDVFVPGDTETCIFV